MNNDLIVSNDYIKAKDLDRKIKTSAQLAQQSLYDMCMSFKEMRDSKLYKELGFAEFGDYCKAELGITDRTAYSYISIAEKLPQDLVKSISLIGTTKLTLLTTIPEETRTEIIENTDLEKTSVKELKAKLAELQETNKKLSESTSKLSALESDAEAYKEKISQLESEVKFKSDSIEALESTIDELENRPIDVAVADNSHEINNLMDAMKRMDLDWGLKYRELQEETTKEIKDKNIAHTKEINQIKTEYEKKISELSVPSTETVLDTDGVFKAYFSIVIDSTKNLVKFIKANSSDTYRKKVIKYFDISKKELEE